MLAAFNAGRDVMLRGQVLMFPAAFLHFLLVFVGCVPFGLTPAYRSLEDEEYTGPAVVGDDAGLPVVGVLGSGGEEKGVESTTANEKGGNRR